ncbi:MAG: hypothetical protein JNL01_10770 [Bdellovibrionales bacterium]|nr:hypothetical protein [Bdellovibrionales bacterium]
MDSSWISATGQGTFSVPTNGFGKSKPLRDFIGVVVGSSFAAVAASALISSTVFKTQSAETVQDFNSFHEQNHAKARQNFRSFLTANWAIQSDQSVLEAEEMELLASGLGRMGTLTEKSFSIPEAPKKSVPKILSRVARKVPPVQSSVAPVKTILTDEATDQDRGFMVSVLQGLRSRSRLAILNHASQKRVLAEVAPVHSDQIVTSQASVTDYPLKAVETVAVLPVMSEEEHTVAALQPAVQEVKTQDLEPLTAADESWIAQALTEAPKRAEEAKLAMEAPVRSSLSAQIFEGTERQVDFHPAEASRTDVTDPIPTSDFKDPTLPSEPATSAVIEIAESHLIRASLRSKAAYSQGVNTQKQVTRSARTPARVVAPTPPVNTQVASAKQRPQPSANTQMFRPAASENALIHSAAGPVRTVGEESPYTASHGVMLEGYEALEPSRTLFGLKSEILSSEGSADRLRPEAWIEVSKKGYVPLVTQVGNDSRYPLLSDGALEVLQLKAGMKQSERAGIVMGQVAVDTEIKLSGRADPVFFVDSEGQSPLVKTFVILNAEPGMQFVRIIQKKTRKSLGIGLPVLAGKVSRLDARTVKSARIRGRILGADVNSAQKLNGVHLKVVGQTEQKVNGTFDLADVSYVPGFPVYIELEAKDGFTHRYSVDPSKELRNDFFLFGANRVQEWVGQLEGGVHPTSGLVVAAFTVMIPNLESKRGTFKVEPVIADQGLDPESYVLGAGEKLLVATPLSPENTIGIGAQVPEGLNQVRIEDRLGKVKWNRWIPSSPGVISVSGDY